MNSIFWVFLGAATVHVVEEYKYPGGFLNTLKRLNPRFAPFITVNFAFIVNALFLLLCLVSVIVGEKNFGFSLSVASLLFLNALTHTVAMVSTRRYSPGVISGVLLYLPISIYGYYYFLSSGLLSFPVGMVSFILGLLYQAAPIAYLALSAKFAEAK